MSALSDPFLEELFAATTDVEVLAIVAHGDGECRHLAVSRLVQIARQATEERRILLDWLRRVEADAAATSSTLLVYPKEETK